MSAAPIAVAAPGRDTGIANAKWIRISSAATRNQSGLWWHLTLFRLRRALAKGSVVLVIGRTGTGKTRLLEKVLPGHVLDSNPLPADHRTYLPVPDSFASFPGQEVLFQLAPGIHLIDDKALPSGPFAIDECAYHVRSDVRRILKRPSGVALAFQHWDQVKRFKLDDLVQKRKVLVLDILHETRAA
ncbi:hypothetical protein ACRCPS_17440 [Pseudomonas aeruginosa]